MTNTTIEQRLELASEVVAWPGADNLADAVTAVLRVTTPPATQAPSRRPGRLVAIAAVVAVATASLMLWAPARRAAADLLGVLGIRIESTSSPVSGATFDITLGTEIDLADVGEVFGFAPLRPDLLAPPDGAYESGAPPGHLTQVWRSTKELPEIGDTGIGVLLTQFVATPESGGFVKALAEATTVQFVSVAGAEGFWIEGGPHDLSYVDAGGSVVEDSTRLAANVLIWETAGITYRLESDLSAAEAIAIAESGFGS